MERNTVSLSDFHLIITVEYKMMSVSSAMDYSVSLQLIIECPCEDMHVLGEFSVCR